MAVKLDTVLARAAAATPDAPPDQLRRTVLEVIAACGLEVDHRQGEVYDPAPRPSSVPGDNWRAASGRGRRGR